MIQATRECDFKPMIAPKSKKLVEKARKKEAAKLISRIQQVRMDLTFEAAQLKHLAARCIYVKNPFYVSLRSPLVAGGSREPDALNRR